MIPSRDAGARDAGAAFRRFGAAAEVAAVDVRMLGLALGGELTGRRRHGLVKHKRDLRRRAAREVLR